MLFKIGSHDLKVGMFVAELDRPWIDTPFLIQGFLIQVPEHVDTVRQHCSYVYVDPLRSAAGVLPDLPVRNRPRPAPFGQQAAATGSLSANVVDMTPQSAQADELSDTGRFMRMTQSSDTAAARSPYPAHAPVGAQSSLTARLKRVATTLLGARSEQPALAPPMRHSFIPASVKLVTHSETRTVKKEFAAASQAFDNAKYVMSRTIADLLAGKPLDLDNVWKVINDIVASMLRNADALTWVAMTRPQDATLYGQGIRNAIYLLLLGRHLGLPQDHLTRLGMIGALLDIGKTTLPLSVLTKPSQLTDEEFALVRGHVDKGLELLKGATELHPQIIEGIAQHHEREDGSGYPRGLSADDISLFGRMAGIVDCFVALTNERTYAQTMPPFVAFRKLTEWSRKLFYAPLIEQFIQAIGVFPVGSTVELSSGEVAIVMRQNRAERLKPQLLVVCDSNKKPLSKASFLDLAEHQSGPGASKPLYITRGLATGSYDISERLLRPA